ncbi:isocitrate dehydrogenase [NAD] subunit gamma, mitochondrial [Neodiprion virginianus]|uniref:Isocitrate dehydrogenase [NAD] subunit gamma, mitochondrial n=1 Tax=Neodiprion lecontei TaxID=441921 RepID=A0A6J0BQY6_NEOLC|nr:isocitrate dehydrogenase [NAD] subunit gamma, mitochondrial [Neodiprion lecontei]XP_046414400.1 isocitrate dehydrogenase [NAD] subunit gamma, mitochondrial [Neodiprion fabricii]XP_046608367.1 isocitrate dehydrogenase [NAD] subunit gamma, mitochondrial [Neodiprion virginianus]
MAARYVSKYVRTPQLLLLQLHRGASTMSMFDIQHKTPTVRKVPNIPKAHYGGRHTVTLLPGAGIGPELMGYVKEVFRYAGVPVDFEHVDIDPMSDNNDDLDYAITTIRRNGVALKGNIETRIMEAGVPSRNVAMRNELDLYINVLHCVSYEGVSSRQKDMDIVIVRQNTEGEYAMLEHESVLGVVESMKVITKSNSERVAKYAFEYARRHGRKKVTTVHKANIMKLSDGLFLETARQMAKNYPEIQHNDMIIDNTCMQLVSNPHQFDIILTTNLYGSIVSNVVCGLLGGAGLLAGKNYGDQYAIFEPGTRNTGSSIAGQNVANPIAMLNAAVDMLRHLGHRQHAHVIQSAINKTINQGVHTRDLGGTATSSEVVETVLKNIKQGVH